MRRVLLVMLIVATAVALSASAAHADEQFTLTASYSGLFPNADVSVPVTVHNPVAYDLAVHTADVTVGDARPGCGSEYLEAFSYSGDVVAPAHGDAVIRVRMHMLATAPDACQGATFPLTFTATGAPTGAIPADAGSSGFAFTGGDVASSVTVGTAALLLGLALLFGRRRRSPEVTR